MNVAYDDFSVETHRKTNFGDERQTRDVSSRLLTTLFCADTKAGTKSGMRQVQTRVLFDVQLLVETIDS